MFISSFDGYAWSWFFAAQRLSKRDFFFATTAALFATLHALHALQRAKAAGGWKAALFRRLVKLPYARGRVEQEKAKAAREYREKYRAERADVVAALPAQGWPPDAVRARMRRAAARGRQCYEDRKSSGAVYIGDRAHWSLLADVMGMHVASNTLHFESFPDVAQMEAEILRMVLTLFRGDASSCAVGTSGGTESILLAMLAYKEQARAERGVVRPNIVCSETAHAAFDKAGFYFGIEVRKAPLTADLLCDVAAMRARVDADTVCLVASSPEYPFGNYDPVAEIAALAERRGIGCHSDACIGFLNVFAEEAGFPLAHAFDFRVPGVTSISTDLHKYGFGPKGYSACLFRTRALRDYQFFTCMDWNGGFYATPSIAGSRPGAVVAGTWAALVSTGREKYVDYARGIFAAQAQLRRAVAAECPEVGVATVHPSPIFAIRQLKRSASAARPINCLALAAVLKKEYQWDLFKTMRPNGLKHVVAEPTMAHWRELVDGIKGSIQLMKADPSLNHNETVALYAMAGRLPDTCVLDSICKTHTAALLDAL